jgi:hypothetical protein
MLASLTWRLAAQPEQGWSQIAGIQAKAESLPTPLRHVAWAGLLSVVATGLGWALKPGTTAAGTVLHMLAALVGYVGGATMAVEVSPKLISEPHGSAHGVSRFAAGAALPIALSGLLNVIPLMPLTFVLALAGTACGVQSGWVGAHALLALDGQARKRAAWIPAGLAVSLVFIATFVRMELPL